MRLALSYALCLTVVSIVVCLAVFAVSFVFGHAAYQQSVGLLAGLLVVGIVLYSLFTVFSLRGSRSVPYMVPSILMSLGVGAFALSSEGVVLGFGKPGFSAGTAIVMAALVTAMLIHFMFLRVIFRFR
jgi:uncharacterized membrane protein (UPF0136 family)